MIAVGEGEELLADGRPGGHLELAHSADVGGFQAVFDLALDHARMPSWQAIEVAGCGPNPSTGTSMSWKTSMVGMASSQLTGAANVRRRPAGAYQCVLRIYQSV